MTAQSGLGFSGIVAIQIPDEGATGEQLTKLSPEDYDYDWAASGAGGQVNSVVGGININVDAGDPVNPIVNLDAAITGVSVNAVTLTAAGVATNFLDETGAYSVPVSAITIEDEGVPLAGLADTLDFVGSGVTASGVGSTKTIDVIDQVNVMFTLSGLFGTILNLFQTNGASPISIDLAAALGLSSLQTLYDVDPSIPHITVNAVPETLTVDASVAGAVFAVRDTADVDLMRMRTTGSDIFGGTGASDILNLQGANAANRGTVNIHGTSLLDFDWVTDIGTYAIRWANTIPASGAVIAGLFQVANVITIDAATFISSTVDDLSNLRWTVNPGFAVQTLFFARPSYRSTTVGISPSQSFMYAAQGQYHLTGAGVTPVITYRGFSFAPIIRVDNAGDELNLGSTTGLTMQPLFNTRNATAVANYGVIRGVHMNNALTILFGLALGSEIATDWIGLDMEALTGLVVSGNRIAVRSAIINNAANFLIQNTGGAQSDFGAGDVHVDDDVSFSFGNTIAAPDAEAQWLPANNALDFSGGRVRVRGAMEYPPITPAALGAGNTNDWTGLLTDAFSAAMRHWARISGNVVTSVLTGIDATAAEDGDTFELTNIAANAIDITDEDVASAAANRFITPTGVTYVLAADETVIIRYDTTTTRWRLLGGTGA